ncbi:MAG TPA: hypothetical protein VFX61_16525 [Micromonosporaceae bacterium]|nr:hypothetical protein [Micromonosporaceae bacterium]
MLATGCGGPADDSPPGSWVNDAGTSSAGARDGLGSAESGAVAQPPAESAPASAAPDKTDSLPSLSPSQPAQRTPSSPPPPTSQKTSSPPPAQPSPSSLCGSGYYVINKHSLPDATTYLLYKDSGGYNCVVTIKTAKVGTATRTGAWLETQDGGVAKDEGDFKYYAGPVRLPAPKTCVKWGGRSGGTAWTSSWSHCG